MPINVYILLDRSGSMANRWIEALSTINAYVKGLADAKHDGAVTVAAFDGFMAGQPAMNVAGWLPTAQPGHRLQFDTLRLATRPQDWKPLSSEDAAPRGDTPLYDAIGRLCTLAAADVNPKGVILLMTDGEENASREVTREGAMGMLDRNRNRGWDVVHLGIDFREVAAQAASLGTGLGKMANVSAQSMRDGTAAEFLTRNTVTYDSFGAGASVVSDADRAKLEKGAQ
ncbi:MAG: hypothetical protein RLZZ403_243 [Pseudomonadota bacterium]|jgi:hypothetical protein